MSLDVSSFIDYDFLFIPAFNAGAVSINRELRDWIIGQEHLVDDEFDWETELSRDLYHASGVCGVNLYYKLSDSPLSKSIIDEVKKRWVGGFVPLKSLDKKQLVGLHKIQVNVQKKSSRSIQESIINRFPDSLWTCWCDRLLFVETRVMIFLKLTLNEAILDA